MSDVGRASEWTLRGALPLVLAISRVLGVAPVRLTRGLGGRWSARVAPRLLSYSYLHFCLFGVYSLLLLILRYEFSINLLLKASDFGDILWTFKVILLDVTVIAGVYGVQARMDAIRNCLITMEPIHQHYKSDKYLRRLYIKEIIVILACLSAISLRIFRFVVFYINDEKLEIDIFAELWKIVLPGYSYLFILTSLLLGQFALPVLRVTAALQAMNRSLRDLLYLSDLQTTAGFQQSDMVFDISFKVDKMQSENKNIKVKQLKADMCRRIRHLSTCFETVQCAVIRLNDSFGFILIIIYSFLLIFITVAPYRLLLLQLTRDVGHVYALSEAYNICMYFLCILVGVQPGHEIEREVSRMRCTVSELLSRASLRVVQDEQEELNKRGERAKREERNEREDNAEVLVFLLSVLSKQLQIPDLCFAPLKFFKLRRPLVPMLLTTSVSLTLILMDTKGKE